MEITRIILYAKFQEERKNEKEMVRLGSGDLIVA